ncbi:MULTISPECIES: Crp/Fnr family transcriptional regulator [Nocardioides]|uniref:cAMP-binding domain of CRP or a regulatory subunit of cAMP-dependent protein kinases n=1 Tax=Nocardioides lianchengensis TaxID=1045774 RepID=A0A1G6LAG0_9ACTN|nr:Crp/Fnr family transcriptional regulator [Nocardioides lianchengensis]NYG12624.1 CRP/FNR family transcriptional regulator [Nocardioides lianchengensis]SDC40191.1 cAMP-binding domain of CRP or a regulatory subunit of cAMP-dependent protein kinases [Nocardioides lianchengensis]
MSSELSAALHDFAGSDPAAAEELLALMTRVHLERGSILFAQGDPGASMYVVARGSLKVTRADAQSRPTILAVLGTGDVFGEMSLLDANDRDATVTAVAATTLLELSRARFDEELGRRPDLVRALLGHLARRLRSSNDTVSDLVFADVPARVARLVVRLGERFGVPAEDGSLVVEHQLTQSELAQLVGSARETVNKALARFAAQGWIDVQQRVITIRDQDRLRAFSS